MSLTIDDVNRMDRMEFVRRFGDVAEHSPWVAEAAALRRPVGGRDALVRAFAEAIREASYESRLALIRAHPDLAGKAAVAAALTEDSRREQSSAGLGSLTPTEMARFTELNDAYKSRFGFPFILAAKGATKHQILAAFEARTGNEPDAEFETALGEIARIIRFRIEDRVSA